MYINFIHNISCIQYICVFVVWYVNISLSPCTSLLIAVSSSSSNEVRGMQGSPYEVPERFPIVKRAGPYDVPIKVCTVMSLSLSLSIIIFSFHAVHTNV